MGLQPVETQAHRQLSQSRQVPHPCSGICRSQYSTQLPPPAMVPGEFTVSVRLSCIVGVPIVALVTERSVALLTILPPVEFPAAVVNLKTAFVLAPPPLSVTVCDREGDMVYTTPLRFELSVTSTVA